MADAVSTTRRAFLKSVPACGMAAIIPSAAMAIDRSPQPSIDEFLSKAGSAEKAWYHAQALADAMNEEWPGLYTATIDFKHGVAVVVDRSYEAPNRNA